MNLIDTLFIKEEKTEQGLIQYCKSTGLINRRDHHGRTPLHVAVAFNNKTTVETLLNLGANPHVRDLYGQRPIDTCYAENLTNLLRVKMTNCREPTEPLTTTSSLNVTQTSQKVKAKSKEDKLYPMEITDIK